MGNNLLKNCFVFGAIMFISSTVNSSKKKTIFDFEKYCLIPYVKNNFNEKILRTISAVESNSGTNTRHVVINSGIHAGQSASGNYGLMPITIIETIKKNTQLNSKYKGLLELSLKDLYSKLEANPVIQYDIANSHLERLTKIFGNKPQLIGYAWLQGIEGTKRAIKEGRNIDNHWHIKKFMREYNKK